MTQPPQNLSVLVVEHRPAIASSIERALEPLDGVRLLDCLPTASLSPASTDASGPDVVVCGLGIFLPQTQTRLSRLRARWPHSHLIALSFDPNAESRDLALALGADDYVSGLNLVPELRAALASLAPR